MFPHLETSLFVDDLERSLDFYQTIFGFQKIEEAPGRLIALSVADRQVLLLGKKGASAKPSVTPGGTIPPCDGTGQWHMAFSIPASELQAWEAWLEEKGVTIESKVTWERGGTSFYFRDPDGHLLELGTPGLWSIY